jgi:Ca-activated chloride channel family protein
MLTCSLVQERLADDGRDALRSDPELRRHLEDCADCSVVLAGLDEVDAALGGLPLDDAPDALVETTLAAVHRAAEREPARAPRMAFGPRELIAGALAASVVVVASLGVMRTLEPFRSYMLADRDRSSVAENKEISEVLGQTAPAPSSDTSAPSSGLAGGFADEADDGAGLYDQGRRGNADKNKKFANRNRGLDAEQAVRELGTVGSFSRSGDDDGLVVGQPSYEAEAFGWDEEEQNYPSESDLVARLQRGVVVGDRKGSSEQTKSEERAAEGQIVGGKLSKDDRQYAGAGNEVPTKTPLVRDTLENARGDAFGLDAPAVQPGVSSGPIYRAPDVAGELRPADPQEEAQILPPPGAAEPLAEAVRSEVLDELRVAEKAAEPPLRKQRAAKIVHGQATGLAAQAFLERIETLDDLAFQPARGYWANSYIPGDPEMRLLEARLRAWDRHALGAVGRLEGAAIQVTQPFDAPRDAGLAVYLRADRSAVDGPSRLTLQVGLKGAEQKAAHRPAMNVALVLHLPAAALTQEAGARLRALVAALDQARRPGDRFSLVLAGPGGGVLVSPEQFRHGPLAVAIERIFGGHRDPQAGVLELRQAIELASQGVRQAERPEDVLGAGLVILATGSPIAGDLTELERSIHLNAVGGVPLSVVSLGAGADLAQIDRLVALGQGNRRILERADEAEALVDRELHAASRAVARAVRLRIRLAPGVKLVDVLGSRRLDEPQAERVRQAEQAIDRRLADDFGIIADRSIDEEGIQIVIPTFHAGDEHVVLLDLVVDGAGPVADVRVRYKDLARLKNGVEASNFSLQRAPSSRGPLERNVLKNRVAWELARGARIAGRRLAAGDGAGAQATLAGLRDLIVGLRSEVDGWAQDAELLADEAMLAEYLTALGSPAVTQDPQRRLLADSLRYAAYRKLQTAASR